MKRIKLYLCPVCIHTDECDILKETCEKYEYNVELGSAWIFNEDCPECRAYNKGSGMLFQDKFGACCCISKCHFSQDYEEADTL